MSGRLLPSDYQLLTAAQVGEMLGYKARTVTESIALRPGFPEPLRLGGGKPRYRKDKVIQWCERQRS